MDHLPGVTPLKQQQSDCPSSGDQLPVGPQLYLEPWKPLAFPSGLTPQLLWMVGNPPELSDQWCPPAWLIVLVWRAG